MALMEELVWFYADDDYDYDYDDEVDQGWRQMPIKVTLEVERLLRCSKHHYNEYGNYLYNFTDDTDQQCHWS